jgi:hypothetical protein
MLTPERGAALTWLRNWWPLRSRAESMLREVAAVFARGHVRRDDRLFLADLARFCNAGDSSIAESDARTYANEGRREVWLHLRGLLGLTEDDTEQLLRETE